MSTALDATIHVLSGTSRGWRGTSRISPAAQQPEKLLKLYDLDVSPFCRLVREVLCEMDIDVLILPCPKNGTRYRPEAKQLIANTTFPLLVDENTGVTMNESADIIAYLGKTYGANVRQSEGLRRSLQVGSSFVASVLQMRSGGLTGYNALPSKAPAQPLELYAFESSPFSKPVKAKLCELELPYILRNCPKGRSTDMGPPLFRDKLFKGPMGTTRNRRWLAENTGQVQVPYLVDPNTGTSMYESADILRYLESEYRQG